MKPATLRTFLLALAAVALPATALFAAPAWRPTLRFAGGLAAAILLLALARSWAAQRRTWRESDAAARRGRRQLLGLALLSLYLAFEGVAAVALYVTEAGDRMAQFRSRYLFESTPILAPHPFLILTNNPASPGVNSLGFIDRERALVREPGSLRIACLGGSTTQDGYTRRLEEILARELAPRAVEVINFGNPAWTSAQLLVNYLLLVREFRPDLVVVLTGANEIKVRGYDGFRPDYAHAFGVLTAPPRRRDAVLVAGWDSYAWLKQLAWTASGREPGIELTDLIQRPGLLAEPLRLEELEPFRRNLRALVRVARADGARVLLSSEPYSRARLEWGGANWLLHMEQAGAAVRAVASEEGVEFVDLDSRMTGQESLFVDPIHLDPSNGVPLKAEIFAAALRAPAAAP